MDNIRTFDTVIITSPDGIIDQRGGTKHDGEWSVVSKHEDFYVLNRGARILRIKPDCIQKVRAFNIDVKIDVESDS